MFVLFNFCDFMNINYRNDYILSVKEFKKILNESTLGERRPIDNMLILEKMLKNCDIMVSAWDSNKIVGVARSISDFGFCTYISDLAVHKDYQRKGIGKELIKETKKLIERNSLIFLVSAPGANDYYPRIGFQKLERAWYLDPKTIID